MTLTSSVSRPRRRVGAAPGVRRPLVAHAAALLGVLVALALLVGPHHSLSADEGAVRAQAQLLADDHTWTTGHPLASVDPSGVAFPLEKSIQVDGRFAPYYKHPLYPLLLTPLVLVAGDLGPVLASIVGAVACALLAAWLARRIDPGAERATFWVVGLVSPLLFDSQLVIAHTLGAALATGAVVAALVAQDRRGRDRLRWAAVAATSLLAATMLRNEALLYGLALAGVLGLLAVTTRRVRDAGLAVLLGAAALAGPLLDRALARGLIGGADAATFTGAASDTDVVAARLHGLWVTALQPSYGARPGADLAALVTVALVVGTALLLRSGTARAAVVRGTATAAALAAAARLILGPTEVIPGLLSAFPLLAGGLVLVDRSLLASRAARVCVGTAGLFAMGVAMTQYAAGGSGEWGGRYFALALPILVPIVVAALARAGASVDAATRRRLVAALAVVCVTSSLTAVASLRSSHDRVGRVVTAVAATSAGVSAGDGGRPVVVTTDPALPRLAWESLDDARWLLVPAGEEARYAVRLRRAGVDGLVFVARDDGRSLAGLVGGYTPRSSTRPLPDSRWTITVLTAR